MYPSGLNTTQVQEKVERGEVNFSPEGSSPSYGWIVFKNIFNLINVFLFPLLLVLFYFEKYQDVFVMSTFAVINSILAMFDEIRIKRRLDQIQVEFASKVKVVREGKVKEIPVNEVVMNDVLVIEEGQPIPVDGVILQAKSLQIDESLLTGESNYLAKVEGDKVIGGSFVVTGECVYEVMQVGKNTYISNLGMQSKAFRKEKSQLQKVGDQLTIFFVAAATIFGLASYFSALNAGQPISEAVVPLTTVVSLIIPQTLVFLFTFSFSISVFNLSKKGVLVQRGSAVESLARLDVLCFDKTGTITSGEMNVVGLEKWGGITEKEIAGAFEYISDKAYGRNQTFIQLVNYFHDQPAQSLNVTEYAQDPFTSRTKMAKNKFQLNGEGYLYFHYGAWTALQEYVKESLQDDIGKYVNQQENLGNRVLVGVWHLVKKEIDIRDNFTSDNVWVVSLKENLNPGIKTSLDEFAKLGTTLKIISGDSYAAVNRVLAEVGIESERMIDLSKFEGKLADIVNDYEVFARAKPENKLEIIRAFQEQNKLVGMTGDGVNDVLALKTANLSIAMESGAKIARDVADIVLLKNDFNKVPEIIFEGENVMANLKFINALFLVKTFHAIFYALALVLLGLVFPLLPSSILIYSFMATSLPSYVVAFLRRKVGERQPFWATVIPSTAIGSVCAALVSVVVHLQNLTMPRRDLNTIVMYATFTFALLFATYFLKRNGYINNIKQLILVPVVVWVIAYLGSVIPIINDYYTVTNLGLEVTLRNCAVAIVFFVAYLVIQKLWDFLTRDK